MRVYPGYDEVDIKVPCPFCGADMETVKTKNWGDWRIVYRHCKECNTTVEDWGRVHGMVVIGEDEDEREEP